MKTKHVLLTLAFALPATVSFAQGPGGPPDRNRPQGPPPPLLHALDADDDGIISAAEITDAPAALKTLDKNKDGQLTREELQPQRPDGPPPGAGPKGPREGDRNRADGPPKGPREGDQGARPPGKRDGDQGVRPPAKREGNREADRGPRPPGDQGRKHPEREGEAKDRPPGQPPVPPLINALDANHDGNISADEIADAAAALKSLDKNSDGQLGPKEFAARPPGPPPQGGPREGDKPRE